MFEDVRAAWDDTLFEAFVFLNSTAILVHFFDPSALEAFEIHLQDVGLALSLVEVAWKAPAGHCTKGKGKGKDKGKGKL